MRVVQLFGRERGEAARFDELNAAHLDANLESITYLRAVFPGDRGPDVGRAGEPDRRRRAPRRDRRADASATVAAFLQLVRRFFQPLQDLRTSSTRCSRRWRRRSGSSRCSTRSRPRRATASGAGARRARPRRAGDDARGVDDRVRGRLVRTTATAGERQRAGVGAARRELRRAARARRWRSWATPARGRRRSSICCCASTIRSAGASRSNGVDIRDDAARRAARADRLRAAGHLPVRRRRRDEHPARSRRSTTRRSLRAAARVGADRVIAPAARAATTRCWASAARRSASASGSCSRSRGRSPPIRRCCVLDEATSAVDSEVEAEIQRGARGADARADDDRHRAPAEHHRGRGRDPRAAPRRGARARDARAAAARAADCTSGCIACRRAKVPPRDVRSVTLASLPGGG